MSGHGGTGTGTTRDSTDGRARGVWGAHTLPLFRLGFAFLGSPVLWSVHFGLIYLIDTLSCTEGWTGAGTAILIITAPFAALSAYSGLVAWRGWQQRGDTGPDPENMFVDVRGRERVLLAVGLMNAVLFTLLIVFEGVTPALVPSCLEARP